MGLLETITHGCDYEIPKLGINFLSSICLATQKETGLHCRCDASCKGSANDFTVELKCLQQHTRCKDSIKYNTFSKVSLPGAQVFISSSV